MLCLFIIISKFDLFYFYLVLTKINKSLIELLDNGMLFKPTSKMQIFNNMHHQETKHENSSSFAYSRTDERAENSLILIIGFEDIRKRRGGGSKKR